MSKIDLQTSTYSKKLFIIIYQTSVAIESGTRFILALEEIETGFGRNYIIAKPVPSSEFTKTCIIYKNKPIQYLLFSCLTLFCVL